MRPKPSNIDSAIAFRQTVTTFPTTLTETPTAIHVNGDGTLVGELINGVSASINVKDGVSYKYQFKTLTSFTGTSIVILD